MFGWIKESAVYEVGYISNGSWDEETSSYQVDIPEVVLHEASTVIEKGYLFLIHGTIEASDGTTEIFLLANKLEKQSTPDGDVIYISFADGSTLTKGLLTIPYSEEGSGGIKNIWDSTGEGAVAGGDSTSTASGIQSLAFGYNCSASNTQSTAFGWKSKATGSSSIAAGNECTASGVHSSAFGSYSEASGMFSFAAGVSTKATQEASTAFGNLSESKNSNAFVAGYNCKANGYASQAFGNSTTANGSNQFVFGSYNVEDNTSLEIVGRGDYRFRGNARKLSQNGDEWLQGQIQPENGLRLKAPNGTYYNVNVDNTGALSITAAT